MFTFAGESCWQTLYVWPDAARLLLYEKGASPHQVGRSSGFPGAPGPPVRARRPARNIVGMRKCAGDVAVESLTAGNDRECQSREARFASGFSRDHLPEWV